MFNFLFNFFKNLFLVTTIMPLNKKYFVAHVGLDSNNQINCMTHNDDGCVNDLLIKKSLCTKYSEKLRPIIGQDGKRFFLTSVIYGFFSFLLSFFNPIWKANSSSKISLMNKFIKLPNIDEIEKVKIQSAKSSNNQIDLTLSLEKYTQNMAEVSQLCQRLWHPQGKFSSARRFFFLILSQ